MRLEAGFDENGRIGIGAARRAKRAARTVREAAITWTFFRSSLVRAALIIASGEQIGHGAGLNPVRSRNGCAPQSDSFQIVEIAAFWRPIDRVARKGKCFLGQMVAAPLVRGNGFPFFDKDETMLITSIAQQHRHPRCLAPCGLHRPDWTVRFPAVRSHPALRS